MSTKLLTKARREEIAHAAACGARGSSRAFQCCAQDIPALLAHIEEQEKALAYVHWWLNDWKYLHASGCDPHAESYDNALALVSAALGEKDEVKS